MRALVLRGTLAALLVSKTGDAWALEPDPDAGAEVPICRGDAGDVLAEFRAAARRGEAAFASMNLARLQVADAQALSIIPCLVDPLPVEAAADFHRLRALRAFTEDDSSLVLAEFHAARRLVPGYVVPEEVAPEGHPLQQLYDFSAGADEGELELVVPPEGGRVVVDGVGSALRPSGVSSIVQVYSSRGTLIETRYLAPGAATPAWGLRPEEVLAAQQRHQLLVGGTVLFGVASLATYTASRLTRQGFEASTSPSEIRRLARTTNGLAWTAVGSGGLALGLGTTAVLVW